jgi:nucleotide-binding universal stress UspA family protein
MFKKILVPTDASDYSRRALQNALELARVFHAEIELLFVMYIPEMNWNFNDAYNFVVPTEEVEKGGEMALEATLKGIDIGDVQLKKKKAEGHPASIILEEIETEGIELVVMGSHGYGPITGSVLGSVSQNVLHRAKCPVLIVK